MDLIPLKVKANCILDEAELYEHIRLALERGLPLIDEHLPHEGTAILVGSGPSVRGQVESIRKQRELGHPIIAIKDAHDWLLSEGLVPDYAVAVDPQEHRWNCFTQKHPDVRYMIASQCHPAMFDWLKDFKVFLWHLYIKEGQTYPPDSLLVTGGTTTGLRAVTLFYSMGFRKFELYGYDSCLSEGQLRVINRSDKDAFKNPIELYVGRNKKRFLTTPEMAAQANEFQTMLAVLPELQIHSNGEGIITTILEERAVWAANDSASFIHYGNDGMASFRYRCRIPSQQLGVPINNLGAKVVIFSKPTKGDLEAARAVQLSGRKVVVDFCDDHFDKDHYMEFALCADAITCPTKAMADIVEHATAGDWTPAPIVIPDPYEYPLRPPHCSGGKVLWFGHKNNYSSLERILPDLEDYQLRVVSNLPGTIMWSAEIMPEEFAKADIVIIPATDPYKSANRAIESIRQGCFVVAEPHPSLEDIPGIWIGNIKEGIEWAIQNPQLANDRTLVAQKHTESFSPELTGNAWKTLVAELSSTSGAGKSAGKAGSTSTSLDFPTFDPTSGDFPSRMDMHM